VVNNQPERLRGLWKRKALPRSPLDANNGTWYKRPLQHTVTVPQAVMERQELILPMHLQNVGLLIAMSLRFPCIMSAKRNSRLLIAIAGFIALAALGLWFGRRQPEQSAPLPAGAAPVTNNAAISHSVVSASVARSPGDFEGKLRELCGLLKTAPDAKAARLRLAELRSELSAMPTNAAVAAVRQFLDSKADAPTHLGFKLASNGLLDEAPTLRTFLLDELARLDSAAAADYSRVVLASMDSPDEWAVALRNLASGDASADGRALLERKMAQMLQYAPWQQNPSVGYLEAFDVAVYLGGTDFLPTLTDLVRQQDNPAVAHASFLALDRLVINNPATVLESLEAEPDLMEGRESTRADFFARADVRDPQQRQILESYLLDPSISTAELQTFASVYPNANFMISPNLLTQTATPNHDALMSLDAQSLAVAQEWLADPRFAQVAPELQTVIQRLEGFAAQAKRGQ